MLHRYGPYDGKPFPTPDALFASPQVMAFILQHGQEAMDALEQYLEEPGENEQVAQMIRDLIDAGMLERVEDGQGGSKLRMTPKMLKGLESHALLAMFEGMRSGPRGEHLTTQPGRSDDRADGTRPYTYGDKLSDVDLTATLRNALTRQHREQGPTHPPLTLHPDDLELHTNESQGDTATCVLIDLSGSMMRYGRFYHAKRVALGLSALIRRQFPQDTVDFVGFSSLAHPIAAQDLPLVMPHPVTLHDPTVRLRTPLEKALANPARIPRHFTNLQLGLREARRLLDRRSAVNKQLFIITDGQPTAHVAADASGVEMLHLLYPPTEQTALITLREAMACARRGYRFASFALIEDYWGMDWVGFIEKMTRLVRGTAFYCAGSDLGSLVVQSYLSGKATKRAVAG